MAASFCWDYSASTGDMVLPVGCETVLFFIGFGLENPISFDERTAFVVRVDPGLREPYVSSTEAHIATEWGDLLRLPTGGPQSQDHPYVIAARSVPTHWVGNSKVFRSVYDLMIAASQHADSSMYTLATRLGDGGWKSYTAPDWHPMSGKMPPAMIRKEDRDRALSIILGIIHMSVSHQVSGHMSSEIKIYANNYSAFSGTVSAVVLAISYFGIIMSGDGTVQEKLNNYAEYRYKVASYIADVTNAYVHNSGETSQYGAAVKMAGHLGLPESEIEQFFENCRSETPRVKNA